MRLAHDDHDIHGGCSQILAEGWGVDGELAGLHGVCDGDGGEVAVAVEANGEEMRAVAEGGVDPLVAEDGDASARGLAIEDGGGGAEQGLAIERGPGGGGLGAVRPGDDDGQ